MKGLILKNAFFSATEYDTQAERLKEELEALSVETDVLRNDSFPVSVDGNIRNRLRGYDFCIYLDKDKYILKALELSGLRTFNRYDAIETCDDKMTTCLALSGHGIDMPLTLPGMLCYDRRAEIPEEKADIIGETLGYPLVVKTAYGSRGTGVFLVNDRRELLAKMRELKLTPHLFQKFIPESRGKDLRVIVIGGKVIGGMIRKSESDFRSNVSLGGKTEACPVSEQAARICRRCAEILGLDYCGIDLLYGKDSLLVCEVNSNAFFYGFERTTGINVARQYAEYIIGRLHKEGVN